MPTTKKAPRTQHIIELRQVRPGSRWWRGVCTERKCDFVTDELAMIVARVESRKHGLVVN